MKEKPILFNAHMVRAILDNRKTQTRRVIKSQPIGPVEKLSACWSWADTGSRDPEFGGHYGFSCPHGKPGDRLWVRETVCLSGSVPFYRADGEPHIKVPWTPSIFMPRSASRFTLEITDVRVERLQDISEDDAEKEGIEIVDHNCYRNYLVDKDWIYEGRNQLGYHALQDSVKSYASLWCLINGLGSWIGIFV